MKKCSILSVMLGALILVLPLFSVAQAEAPAGFSVEWLGEKPTLTGVASWIYEGERYEMAITGLKSRISEDRLAEMVQAFHEGKDAQLTNPALTDAEKFSHLVPHRAGDESTWVVMDEVRSENAWGDSLQCWAASAANMLSATGWAALAKDQGTGEVFLNEDAVFSYLTRCFENEGDFQADGVEWFFSGKADDESLLRENAERKKLLPDNPKRYMLSLFTEQKGTKAYAILSDMALAIKKGASMGISITINSTSYRLLADPEVTVNIENGRFMELCLDIFEEEEYLELPEHYWTFAADGSVIVLEKTDESYFDESGREFPAMSVKKDHLYYDEVSDTYYIPEKLDNSGTYTVFRYIEHAADEVDLEHPIVTRGLGNGVHAVTVSGYIRNVSEENDGMKGMRAMLLADSDNDANIWQVDANTTKKEDRPNTYKLCYTEKAEVENTVTIDLTNYMVDGTACIAYACLLYPKVGPIPVTGDLNQTEIYAALLLCAGVILFISIKKLKGFKGD